MIKVIIMQDHVTMTTIEFGDKLPPDAEIRTSIDAYIGDDHVEEAAFNFRVFRNRPRGREIRDIILGNPGTFQNLWGFYGLERFFQHRVVTGEEGSRFECTEFGCDFVLRVPELSMERMDHESAEVLLTHLKLPPHNLDLRQNRG